MNKGELNILIVDDDEEDLLLADNLLRESLKGIALEVERIASFAEGLTKAETARYDLFLLDYQLGDRCGFDFLRELRARGIESPAVFLTGHGGEEVAVEAMKLGASDYLPKAKLTDTLLRKSILYAVELHEKEKLRKRAEAELYRTNRDLESLVRDLESRNRESCLLNDLGNALQTCVCTQEAYAQIAQRICNFAPGHSGALCIFEPSRRILEAVHIWGNNPPPLREFTIEECWSLRRGRAYWVWDSGVEIMCPHLKDSGWKSHFCIPLQAHGETMGVLVLQGATVQSVSADAGRCGSEPPRQFVESLSEQLALALSNLKLREALAKQALQDPLTGLFNRRYMEESLERNVSSARRHKRPLAVLMVDLDHFKSFNDRYGHEAGDAVLRFLGQFLHAQTRGEDIACRYGGEEFVVILPDAPLAAAAQRAAQLRAKLREARPRTEFPWRLAPTISIGISAAPEHGFSAQQLLTVADTALFQAKAQGRNCEVIGECATPSNVLATLHQG